MSRARARKRLASRQQTGHPPPPAAMIGPADAASSIPAWIRWILPLVVAAITFAAFLPALDNGFVNWDDDKVLLQNNHFRGLGDEQLEWMFTAYWMGHYHPLTWMSFAVDYLTWGIDDAYGFHLTNVLLHTLNTAFFYFLVARLLALAMGDPHGRKDTALLASAALAALVFGIHPLRVESVAWVTERRDVLSLSFLLPCVLCYLRYVAGGAGRRFWYTASVVLLLFSLLSKAWGITLPVVLLVLDIYPLRRVGAARKEPLSSQVRRVLIDKLPFVVLAASIAFKAASAQATAVYTMKTLDEHGLAQRAAQAAYGLAFYVWKTVCPVGLAPLYEIPIEMNPLEPRFIAAGVVVIAGIAAILLYRRRWRAGPALLAIYVITLAPVLGLAQSGPQLVADRYSYVSCLTLAVLVGAACLWLVRWLSGRWSLRGAVGLTAGVAVVVVGMMTVLTWRQARVWRTSQTLWEHCLTICPDSRDARYNLGVDLANRQEYDRAIERFNETLRLDPHHSGALASLGRAWHLQGETEQAIPKYMEALRLKDDMSRVHRWLGSALQEIGNTDEAARHFSEAIRLEPESVEASSDLGIMLVQQGRIDAALPHLAKAVEADPNNATVRYNLGLALAKLGRLDQATKHFTECVRLAPNNFDARSCLAGALAMQGQIEWAVANYQVAVRIRPDSADTHGRLADLLQRQGKNEDAVVHYRAALRVAPEKWGLVNNLATLLMTTRDPRLRDPTEAVRLAEEACRGTNDTEPAFLRTLAGAYAEAGRFDEAIQTIHKLMPQAIEVGDQKYIDDLHRRLEIYEARRAQGLGE